MMTRNETMVDMRKAGYTLREIGELFGVSRERVRQIVGPGRESRIARRVRRAYQLAPWASNWDIARIAGTNITMVQKYIGRRRSEPAGGAAKKGYTTEEKFIADARLRGLPAAGMVGGATYDVDCGGVRVEVKTGSPCRTNPNVKGRQLHFALDGKDNKSDVLALNIPDTHDWFIVPSETAFAKKTRHLYVVWPRDLTSGGYSFLHSYLNRWDILRDALDNQQLTQQN